MTTTTVTVGLYLFGVEFAKAPASISLSDITLKDPYVTVFADALAGRAQLFTAGAGIGDYGASGTVIRVGSAVWADASLGGTLGFGLFVSLRGFSVVEFSSTNTVITDIDDGG